MNGFLKKTVQVYGYLGSWPLKESSIIFENFRYYFGLFIVLSIAIFNALQYVDIYFQWGRWEYFSENATVSFIFTTFLFKVQVFYGRRDEIVKISTEMDTYVNEIYSRDKTVENINCLRLCQRRAEKISNFFWTTTFFTIIVIYAWPISTIFYTRDYSLRPLGVRAYFPFSLNSTSNYAIAYLGEMILGSVMTLHTIAFDTFFVSCILFAIARLRILQHSLETVNVEGRRELGMNPKDVFTSVKAVRKFRQITASRLRKCVQEHQKIISFCKKIDSMLSLVLLIVFFVYAVIICFVGFYALLLGTSLDLLKAGQYLGALLLQIFLYYWHGNELMTESLKVADSALKSDWYDFGNNNVKIIMFVIFRSQRPITLTVGKFYTVTLETFLALLSSSYSYFALLKQFYE